MASLNKVMIIGHLGRDPEVNYTPGGAAICKFSVATSESWNDKNTGEKRDKTEWHRVTVFGKMGENCGRYLAKGRQVYVEGKLQTSSYEKDGITRYSTDIIASGVTFLGSQGDQSGQQSGGYQNQGPGQGQGYGNQNQGGGYQQPPQQRNEYQSNNGGHQGGHPGSGQPQQGYQVPPDDDSIPF